MEVLYPNWTKILNLSTEIIMTDFGLSHYFTHVANVIANTSPTRQTVIQFSPLISKEEWKKNAEWIYMFTINDKIVKIGGTRTGLAGRASSYLCGHHISERGKSRDCSKTNGYIYNTFDHCIRNGDTIEMWGYQIEPVNINLKVWGEDMSIVPQVYTAFETQALEAYYKKVGHYPCLNDNSDPAYRSSDKSKRSRQ